MASHRQLSPLSSFKFNVISPHLYNSLLRLVRISPCHAMKNVNMCTDDPDLPAAFSPV